MYADEASSMNIIKNSLEYQRLVDRVDSIRFGFVERGGGVRSGREGEGQAHKVSSLKMKNLSKIHASGGHPSKAGTKIRADNRL